MLPYPTTQGDEGGRSGRFWIFSYPMRMSLTNNIVTCRHLFREDSGPLGFNVCINHAIRLHSLGPFEIQ